MQSSITRLCLLMTFVIASLLSYSQCITAPPAPPACTGSEPLVTSGEVINKGVTKYYYGATATFNDLAMNGGTLIVCGDLTIDKFSMDSGVVYIRPGARFVIGSGIGSGIIFRGNSAFYNYGTLECQRNFSFEGGWASPSAPNLLINATGSSVLKISNQYFVINNKDSWFVNKGKAEFGGIIVDPQGSAGSVCLGNYSETKMMVMINKVRHSYRAPEGSACVSISTWSQFYDTLTNTPTVNVCLGPSHTTDVSCGPWGCRPNAWGAANRFNNCNACVMLNLLPVRIVSFKANVISAGVALQWQMDAPANYQYFRIERSSDGRHFSTIDSMYVAEHVKSKDFFFVDKNAPNGNVYYRLVCTNRLTGAGITSDIIKLTASPLKNVQVFPNPFMDHIVISLPQQKTGTVIRIHSADGENIMSKTIGSHEAHELKIDFPASLAPGTYILTIVCGDQVLTKKLVNNR